MSSLRAFVQSQVVQIRGTDTRRNCKHAKIKDLKRFLQVFFAPNNTPPVSSLYIGPRNCKKQVKACSLPTPVGWVNRAAYYLGSVLLVIQKSAYLKRDSRRKSYLKLKVLRFLLRKMPTICHQRTIKLISLLIFALLSSLCIYPYLQMSLERAQSTRGPD